MSAIQWVVIAYILTDACLLLPAGRLADRAGHHRVFGLGLAITAVALLCCGVAPSLSWLLAARALQGVGAALVFASGPALVTLATPEPLRQRALGWYNLAFGAGIVLGPLLGGVVIAAWSWRAVYLARVPLAAVALLLSCRGLRAGPAVPGLRPPPANVGESRRSVVLPNATNFVANVALFFVWLLVPYYLVDLRGVPVVTAGVLFAIGTLAMALGAPLGGRWAEAWSARRVVPLALAIEAAGLALTSRLDRGSSALAIALALALAGGGAGLFAVPNMYEVMSARPRGRQGWAGSLVALMRLLGIVAGARLATWAYEGRLRGYRAAGFEGLAAELAFRDAFAAAAAIAVLAVLLGLAPQIVKMGSDPRA